MPYGYCTCGCQSPTRSEFRPGHALRYMARLRREALAGDSRAIYEMYRLGWNIQPAPGRISFGVEAEFYGMSQATAAEVLAENGINAKYDGYHHESRPYWRITEDGSVSYEGCELVSPVLRMVKDDMDLMRKAVDILRVNGGEVNRSCGLHIHHNSAGHTPETIAQAVAHYALFQPKINTMLPRSRWHASYAEVLDGAQHWYDSIIAQSGGNRTNITRLARNASYWGRYHAINVSSLQQHGTLEFRQHSGTLNPDKVEHWTRFTKSIMDSGKRGLKFEDLIAKWGSEDAVTRNMSLADILVYLKVPAKTRKFLLARANSLTSGAPDQEDASSEIDNSSDDPYWCESCGESHEPDDYDEEDEDY